MNYKNITIGIVTFKSEKVIFNCLKSITGVKKIIIFDNSNDLQLKKKINNQYPQVKIILSKKNIGYGQANNRIFKLAETSHVLVLNPDTILNKNCLKELIIQANLIKNKFAILAPSEKNKNYGFFKEKQKKYYITKNLISVDYVKGFAMLLNMSKIKKVGMFDANYFLYLEEIDLCKRLKLKEENIYLCNNAKIKHISATSSNIGFEFEKCQNWHWMWSQVYFDRKFNNYIYALKNNIFKLIKNFLKAIIFLIIFNRKKSYIFYLRFSGIYNSLIGNKSWFRPKLD